MPAHTLPGSFLDTAVDAARAAGTLLKAQYGAARSIEYKGVIDLVTEMDRAAEKHIAAIIAERHPDHALMAEEGSELPSHPGSSDWRWIVDPLDGTVNYAHGLPWYAVSIALQHHGRTQVGAVYHPMTDEMFTAWRGGGAYLNGTPIRVSNTPELGRSLLATGFPYDVRERLDEILSLIQRFLQRGQGLRRFGSAALDLCYVACGRYDGFWELGLHVWDVAAAILIVHEAGGRVSDFGGHPGELIVERVVASNGLIHDAMLETIRGT